MKNVTVTLDERTARWARLEAARREMSVSSLVRMVLEQQMSGQDSYEASRRRFLARSPRPLKQAGRYPSREELHERAGLR